MNAVAAMLEPRSGGRLTLADGAVVEIRPLERSDRAVLASAVARFAALLDGEGVVDVAVTVGDRWQGRGLGTALLGRLVERARDEGHLGLHASVLAENTPCIATLRRAGFVSRTGTGVQLEFELVVPPPAPSDAPTARREKP